MTGRAQEEIAANLNDLVQLDARHGRVLDDEGEQHDGSYRLRRGVVSYHGLGGGLVSEDLEKLHDYGESGWKIDHVVAHGENQNAMLFVFNVRLIERRPHPAMRSTASPASSAMCRPSSAGVSRRWSPSSEKEADFSASGRRRVEPPAPGRAARWCQSRSRSGP